ncbi:hypothetical protein BH09VER1_BH09VER1_29720 [soil metagenome]
MNENTHTTILERYFFGYIDRQVAADETPLFTGNLGGEPLAAAVARDFSLSAHEAEAALEAARQEVAL